MGFGVALVRFGIPGLHENLIVIQYMTLEVMYAKTVIVLLNSYNNL